MLLVDIGNTNIHIYNRGEVYNLKFPVAFEGDVFYISVNEKKEKEFLKLNPQALNLKHIVTFDTSYTGLGIDRIMACKAVEDGVVVDAGSAVTIDIMQNSVHLGGVIMPGIKALKESYAKISKKLDVAFSELDFKKLPQNTSEAVTFGSVGSIVVMVEYLRKNKKVYLTGGDGKFLSRFVKESVYIRDLVFRGMIKTIKEFKGIQ